MEPTSEQELKQLLEEGKITEAEYQELLEAIQQKETVQKPAEKPSEPKPRSGYGKAALILMIAGILLQIPGVSMILLRTSNAQFLHLLGVGAICELLAFIFGIISWKTTPGKIVAIGVPCLWFVIPFFGGFLFAFLFSHQRVEVQGPKARHLINHRSYSLDSLESVLTQDGVEFDNVISADGNGSLKFFTNSADKAVFRLFETAPTYVYDETNVLIYSAQVKSKLESGRAYLEMWCDIPGKSEFFSRGLERPVTGTTNWTTVQTPFRLEAGQMPANVKLNLVIEGTGTVWIDDIKLLSSPLN